MVKPYGLRSKSEPSYLITETRAKRAGSTSPSKSGTRGPTSKAPNTVKLDLALSQGTLSSKQGMSCIKTSTNEDLTPDFDILPLTHSTPKALPLKISALVEGLTSTITTVETPANSTSPAETIPVETPITLGDTKEISSQKVSLLVESIPEDVAPSSQSSTPSEQLKFSSSGKPETHSELSQKVELATSEITDKQQSKHTVGSPVKILTTEIDQRTCHDGSLEAEVETVEKQQISEGVTIILPETHLELGLEKRLPQLGNPQIVHIQQLPKIPEEATKNANTMEEIKSNINNQPINVHKVNCYMDSIKVDGFADCDVSSTSDMQDSDNHMALSLEKTKIVSCDSVEPSTKSNACGDDVEQKLEALFEGHTFGIDSPKGIANNSTLNESLQRGNFDCSFGVDSPNSMVLQHLPNHKQNTQTSSDMIGTAKVQDSQTESSTRPAQHLQAMTEKITPLSVNSSHLENSAEVLGTSLGSIEEEVDVIPDISQTGGTQSKSLSQLGICQKVTEVGCGEGLGKEGNLNSRNDVLQTRGSRSSCENQEGSLKPHCKNLLKDGTLNTVGNISEGSGKPCNAGRSSPKHTKNSNATQKKHLSQGKRTRSQIAVDDKMPKRKKRNSDVRGHDSTSGTSLEQDSVKSPSDGVSVEQADKDETVLVKRAAGSNSELMSTTLPHVFGTKPKTIEVSLVALVPGIDGLVRNDSKNLLKGFCWSGCKRLTVFSVQLWRTDETTNVLMPCCQHCKTVEGVVKPTQIDYWFTATLQPVGTQSTMEVIFSSTFGAKFLDCLHTDYARDPAQRKRVHLKLLNLIKKKTVFKLRYTKVKVNEEYHYRAA